MKKENLLFVKKSGRPSNKPDDEKLLTLYQTMTAAQIAESYGVAVSTVKGWIRSARKKILEGEKI